MWLVARTILRGLVQTLCLRVLFQDSRFYSADSVSCLFHIDNEMESYEYEHLSLQGGPVFHKLVSLCRAAAV